MKNKILFAILVVVIVALMITWLIIDHSVLSVSHTIKGVTSGF